MLSGSSRMLCFAENSFWFHLSCLLQSRFFVSLLCFCLTFIHIYFISSHYQGQWGLNCFCLTIIHIGLSHIHTHRFHIKSLPGTMRFELFLACSQSSVQTDIRPPPASLPEDGVSVFTDSCLICRSSVRILLDILIDIPTSFASCLVYQWAFIISCGIMGSGWSALTGVFFKVSVPIF